MNQKTTISNDSGGHFTSVPPEQLVSTATSRLCSGIRQNSDSGLAGFWRISLHKIINFSPCEYANRSVPRWQRDSHAIQTKKGEAMLHPFSDKSSDHLTNSISRYVGSGQRSSATIVSSLSPRRRASFMAGSTPSR